MEQSFEAHVVKLEKKYPDVLVTAEGNIAGTCVIFQAQGSFDALRINDPLKVTIEYTLKGENNALE